MIALVRIVLLLFLLQVSSYAQVSLKGKVLDSTGAALPFSPVALLNADSTIVKGIVSNDQGEYLFERIPKGVYIMKVIVQGFETVYSEIVQVDTADIILSDIILKQKSVNLAEVSVTAVKRLVEFKDGMVVMNVENSPLTSGNTAFDLVKRLPGVYVDNQNNIFLNGKSGVRVMIDGRLQRLPSQQLVAVLSGMSAESISKIEVMNNPPAKYDSEGTGGMINIVTKRVKMVGLSGSISGGYSRGIADRGGVDAALNYKGRKITVFSNFGYANRIFYSNYIFDKTVPFNGNITYLKEVGEQINYQELFYYKLGADYYVNDKTTIGFLVNGGPAQTPMSDIGINRISGYNGLGFDHSLFAVHVTDDWSNPGYNINAEHRFDTSGTQLNFAADYSNYKGTRKSLSENPFFDATGLEVLPANDYKSITITDIRIATQKLDFTKKIGKTVSLETGAKVTFTDSRNDYTFERKNNSTGIFESDTNYSNKYVYRENIAALYLNFKKQFARSSLQVGGRGENTIVNAHNTTSAFKLTRQYFFFFPNVTYDYTGSEKHGFQISVSRRIDRPNYRDLNPYKSYQDNYSSTIGNPYLLPQTVYNASLTYSYNHVIYNTFSYSRFTNLMLSFDFQNDSTKENISTNRNITGGNYYAYNLFLQKRIKTYANVTLSGSVFYQDFIGSINGTALNRSAFAYNGFMNNEFLLPKNFKIVLSFQYVSPSVYGVNYISQRWAIDLGVRRTFKGDRFTVNLSFFDIFYKNYFSVNARFQNMDYIFCSRNDSRRVWLNIIYKFGKIKVQKRQVNSNDQEKERLDDKLKR